MVSIVLWAEQFNRRRTLPQRRKPLHLQAVHSARRCRPVAGTSETSRRKGRSSFARARPSRSFTSTEGGSRPDSKYILPKELSRNRPWYSPARSPDGAGAQRIPRRARRSTTPQAAAATVAAATASRRESSIFSPSSMQRSPSSPRGSGSPPTAKTAYTGYALTGEIVAVSLADSKVSAFATVPAPPANTGFVTGITQSRRRRSLRGRRVARPGLRTRAGIYEIPAAGGPGDFAAVRRRA